MTIKVASRVPDFEAARKAHNGWNSPHVRAGIEKHIGARVIGEVKVAGDDLDTKAVADSTAGSGGTLIQQGIEPTIYENFVRRFPLYDLIEKEESNGLVHAYDVQNTYSGNTADQPVTMTEDGTVADDKNAYAQATTNIAIFGTRRGASLKSMFAVRQGVGGWDLSARELDGGMTKIAHDVQAELCRFQNTNAAASADTDPNGLYDANGFNGLRYALQNTAPAGHTIAVDTTSGYSAANRTILATLGAASDAIVDALGVAPDAIITSVAGKRWLLNEQLPIQRYMNQVEVRPGVSLASVELDSGDVPIYALPGDAVGSYIVTGTPNKTYIDVFLVVSNTLSIPWLGGPTPTVLEIPIGADGTLRKLYIPFLMVGFAMHLPAALARVQIRIA